MKDKFFEIDYQNLTFEQIINFKTHVLIVHQDLVNFLPHLSGFSEMTNGAYGYLDNPYKYIKRTVVRAISVLESIKKHLPEERVYELSKYTGVTLALHANVLFPGREPAPDLHFLTEIEKLDEQLKLYQKAKKEYPKIVAGYLGFKSGEKGGKHYKRHGTGTNVSFRVITPGTDYLRYKEYSIDVHKSWDLWSSGGTIDMHSTEYRKLNKRYYPENFI